jgi:sporulation protein YlmC with PRC-barrel domain
MVPQLGVELPGRTVRCETENAGGDPHLRSVREVIGYQVEARDGRIGSVSDMIADDETWRIRHLAIDPGSWLNGQQTLVVPLCVSRISWANRAVAVDLTADQVRDGLRFDPAAAVNLRHEIHFYDYYGRPKRLEPGAAGVITPAGPEAPTARMMVQGPRNG